MNTADERKAFRKRISDLSEMELTRWLCLVGLVSRVETELLAYHALFEPGSEIPPVSDELSGIQLMLMQELKKRNSAKTKTALLTVEELNNHANHEQNGTH
jgi:hypothetical protein